MSEREDIVMSPPPPPPPPSDGLRALVAQGGATPLRKPARELLLLSSGFFAWALLFVLLVGPRRDMPMLPMSPYLVSASAWALTALLALGILMMPARGQVLPSASKARMAVLTLPVLVAAVAAALLVEAPGRTVQMPASQMMHSMRHCLGLGLAVSLVPLALALYLVRARLIVARASTGALFGVATGVLAALVLHLVCPVGGLPHLLAGHAASMLVAAVLGAALASFFGRRA